MNTPRWVKALLGSAVSFLVGMVAGVLTAHVYERIKHPGDPDPVDFSVGFVFLVAWAAIWLIGTAVSIWLEVRPGRRLCCAPPPKPTKQAQSDRDIREPSRDVPAGNNGIG